MTLRKIVAGLFTAGAVLKGYEHLTTSKHDQILKKTYKNITSTVSDDIDVTAEHGVGEDGNGNRSDENINGHPDLVVSGFSVSNLIVEVETSDVVENDPNHITEQLSRYAKQGYRRVLVVPSDAVEAAENLCTDIEGKVTVSTPTEVTKLL